MDDDGMRNAVLCVEIGQGGGLHCVQIEAQAEGDDHEWVSTPAADVGPASYAAESAEPKLLEMVRIVPSASIDLRSHLSRLLIPGPGEEPPPPTK